MNTIIFRDMIYTQESDTLYIRNDSKFALVKLVDDNDCIREDLGWCILNKVGKIIETNVKIN